MRAVQTAPRWLNCFGSYSCRRNDGVPQMAITPAKCTICAPLDWICNTGTLSPSLGSSSITSHGHHRMLKSVLSALPPQKVDARHCRPFAKNIAIDARSHSKLNGAERRRRVRVTRPAYGVETELARKSGSNAYTPCPSPLQLLNSPQ